MDNPFATEYNELTDEQKADVKDIKDKAFELLQLINKHSNILDPRMLACSKTKLEESVMWAVKAITNPPNPHGQRFEK